MLQVGSDEPIGSNRRPSAAVQERLGFEARHILDIGAHVGNWTRDAQVRWAFGFALVFWYWVRFLGLVRFLVRGGAAWAKNLQIDSPDLLRSPDVHQEVFPDAQFLMIEANPLHHAQLAEVGHPFVIALLAAKGNESRRFHSTRYPVSTGASMFREKSDLYMDARFAETMMLPTRTLDEVVLGFDIGCCDLIKADVQGAEISVLLGGLRTLSQAQLVLLEAPVLPYNQGAPLFSELISFMAQQGCWVLLSKRLLNRIFF